MDKKDAVGRTEADHFSFKHRGSPACQQWVNKGQQRVMKPGQVDVECRRRRLH